MQQENDFSRLNGGDPLIVNAFIYTGLEPDSGSRWWCVKMTV